MAVKGSDNEHKDDDFMWKLGSEGPGNLLQFVQKWMSSKNDVIVVKSILGSNILYTCDLGGVTYLRSRCSIETQK